MLAVAVALLGLTGCGGSSDAPPTAAAPATPGAVTAPVSTSGGSGGDNIAKDIAGEHTAAVGALRVWGKQASKVCREARADYRDGVKRLKAMIPKGRKFTRSEQERFGREFLEWAREGERTYAELREIALPRQAEAVERIQSFFDKVEESLTIAQRFGIEVEEYGSVADMLEAARREQRLSDDLKRDARAVKAGACVSSS